MKLKDRLKEYMKDIKYTDKQIKENMKKAELHEREIDFRKTLPVEQYNELTKLIAEETVKELNKLREKE